MATKDIYTKLPQDINYFPQLETEDDIQKIVQQIKMILGTEPGQVLGVIDLGINLKQYLFAYTLDTNAIRRRIIDHITQYVSYDTNKYDVDVDLKYGKEAEDGSDYVLIDISINQQKIIGIIVDQ